MRSSQKSVEIACQAASLRHLQRLFGCIFNTCQGESLNDSALSPKRLSKRDDDWQTGSHPTEVGLRGFPRSPRAPSSRYWGEPSNFERWRLVFLSLFSPEFLGRSLGKMKNSFKRIVSHPASVAAATEGVAGANAVIFSETEESKARGNPIRKRCCSLHGPTWRKRLVFRQSLSTRSRPGNVL